ncbi:MAG: hypothetical protein JWM10_3147 [Myxococcaceae bacterium]|nr:hypothetical protein [Myxococcaceae bacterium]
MESVQVRDWGHVGCEFVDLSVRKALVGYALSAKFGLQGPRHGARDHRDLTGVAGELSLGNGDVVCRLEHQGSFVRIHANSPATFEMAGHVDHAHLEAIEARRSGGDIAWKARFWGLVFTPDRPDSFQTPPCALAVPQSEWVKALAAAQWSRLMLIEVPMPDPQDHPEMARALGFLAQARERLGRGEYRGAVAHCREALEALGHAKKDPGSQNFPVKEGDLFAHNRGKTKEERFQLLRFAARVVTHPAHHAGKEPEAGVPDVEYDRADAYAIVMHVAMLIAQASRRP